MKPSNVAVPARTRPKIGESMRRVIVPAKRLTRKPKPPTVKMSAVGAVGLAEIAQAMRHPSFELDANEAAAILSAVARAQAKGIGFDEFTLALVDVLRRQLAGTDEGLEDPDDEEEFEDADAEPEHEGHDIAIAGGNSTSMREYFVRRNGILMRVRATDSA